VTKGLRSGHKRATTNTFHAGDVTPFMLLNILTWLSSGSSLTQ